MSKARKRPSSKPAAVGDSAEALLAKALELQGVGLLPQAAAQFRRYLKRRPDHAEALHGAAGLCVHLGQHAQAAAYLNQAVAVDPRNPDFLNDLGAIHLVTRDFAAASECFKRVLGLAPDYAGAWYNLGLALLEQGRFEDAVGPLREAVRRQAGFADAHFNLGCALQGLGHLGKAAEAFERCIQLQPLLKAAHLRLGRIWSELRRWSAAVQVLEQAVRLDPADPHTRIRLSDALQEAGRTGEALETLDELLRTHPRQVSALVQRGRLLHMAGDIPGAEAAFLQALEVEPGHSAAWLHLARVRRWSAADGERIERMAALLAGKAARDEGRQNLHFALGKVLDDCGEYDRAFEHFRRANALQRAGLRYDREGYADSVSALIEVFDSAFFEARRELGSEAELPLIVCGMPRSGTTLVEQILASHPQAAGAGELMYFGSVALGLPRLVDNGEAYPYCCRAMGREPAEAIVRNYLELLRRHSATARLVSDKLPDNYNYLGLIRLLFPRAPIVVCRRDPLDVCLSIYFQFFNEGHPYACDLLDIGHRYLQFERLMDHWRRVLPGGFLEVGYETLTRDTEAQVRRLLAHCGLPWDPACLRFHEQKRDVRTASNWQVRQPIYTFSRQRWRRYERHLGPLLELLRAAGRDPGRPEVSGEGGDSV